MICKENRKLLLVLFFCFSVNLFSHTKVETFSNPVASNYNFDGEVLTIFSDYCDITVQPFTDDIIKVLLHLDGVWESDTSLSVIRTSLKPNVNFTNTTNYFELSTKNIKIRIDKNPIKFYYYRGDTVVAQDLYSIFKHEGYRGVRWKLYKGEKIYGGGARALPVNRYGRNLTMFNRNEYRYESGAELLNTCIPFFISSRLYGIYFDNHSFSYASTGLYEDSLFQFHSRHLEFSYYFINGSTNQEILSNYLWLTGSQPLIPRWAMGYFQSKYAYIDQESVLKDMYNMRKDGFPVDAVIHDLAWFQDMGDFDWSKTRFPDAPKMLDSLQRMGIKTLLISECYVSENSYSFPDIRDKKLIPVTDSGTIEPYFVLGDNKYLLDFTYDSALIWIWNKYRTRTQEGIDGWWLDLGEPDLHDWNIHHKLGLGINVHNIYGLLWVRHLYEQYRKEFSDRRPFFISRAGWAGLQRFGAIPLCGDEARTFSALKIQIPLMLGMSMSGSAYMHSDGGGYDGCIPNRQDELYTRWLQFITFQPIMRVHMTANVPVEPCYYPYSVKSIVREYAKLRYSLLPYNYTLTWLNSSFNKPIAIPMNFDYPFIEELSDVNDQYFWGNSFIVAPVLDSGVTSRKVILTEGNWINYWTGEKYKGNSTITVDAPLSILPLFVRSGSFIPKAPPMMTTDCYNADSLIIDYYPDIEYDTSSYTMYDDDGKTPDAHLKNLFELITFRGKVSANLMSISVTKGGYSFENAPTTRNLTFTVINPSFIPGMAFLNNKYINTYRNYEDFLLNDTSAYYDSTANRLLIKFTWAGDSSVINITDTPSIVIEGIKRTNRSVNIVSVNPNPFTYETCITYTCGEACNCEIAFFDCNGKVLYSETIPSLQGKNSINIAPGNIALGAYFLILKSPYSYDIINLIKNTE